MADIIELNEKIREADQRRRAAVRKRKLEAVRNVLQCSHCSMKCEKCGTRLDDDTPADPFRYRDLKIPYRLCDSCSLEYRDYIQRLQGGGDRDCYWHNQAWLDSWGAWIAYRGTLDRYLRSKEFCRLLEELKQEPVDS